MRKKKNNILIPVILFVGVLVLSVGGLILANRLRQAEIANPGEYSSPDDIPRVTVSEAYQALSDGDAVLVDTRSASEYQTSHIAGAINIPIDQVESRVGELDPDTWYITYCT